MPDYAMTVVLPKRRYGDIVEAEDARDAFWRMLHDLPFGAQRVTIQLQQLEDDES